MSTSHIRSKGCSSHCACFLVLLLAQPVSLASSPTQPWEPRGVPLGTGTSVPRVGGHAVHRDEESPPRGRSIASPRTTEAVFRWRGGKKKHQGSAGAGKKKDSDKKKEVSARIKTLQGLNQQSEGVEGLEDFVSRLDQDVEETKRQIIESKPTDSQIWGVPERVRQSREACQNATPPLPSFSARSGKPSNPWSGTNRTLQELEEKARTEVGSCGPRYCNMNVDAQGQDVRIGTRRIQGRIGTRRTMSKSRIPRGTPLCGGIRLGVLPHGRARSKNLHSWALSLRLSKRSREQEVSTLAVPVTPRAARVPAPVSENGKSTTPAPGPTQRTTSAFGVLQGPNSRSPKGRGQDFCEAGAEETILSSMLQPFMRIEIFWLGLLQKNLKLLSMHGETFLWLLPILSTVLDSQIPRRRSFHLLGFVVKRKVIPFFHGYTDGSAVLTEQGCKLLLEICHHSCALRQCGAAFGRVATHCDVPDFRQHW